MEEMKRIDDGPTDHPIPPPADVRRRERHAELTWDDVANKLLQEKLLLTALELHTELVEAGCELSRLRDYFSNPANFEQYTTRNITDLHTSGTHPPLTLRKSINNV